MCFLLDILYFHFYCWQLHSHRPPNEYSVIYLSHFLFCRLRLFSHFAFINNFEVNIPCEYHHQLSPTISTGQISEGWLQDQIKWIFFKSLTHIVKWFSFRGCDNITNPVWETFHSVLFSLGVVIEKWISNLIGKYLATGLLFFIYLLVIEINIFPFVYLITCKARLI